MQKNHRRWNAFAALTLTLVLISVFGTGLAFAAPAADRHTASGGTTKLSATREKSGSVSARGARNMYSLPKVKASSAASSHKKMPVLTGVSAATFAQRKAAATHNSHAPHATAIPATDSSAKNGVRVGFPGLADSATICPYFQGCAPPDMALATSPKYVFQGVNTSFALYDTHGTLLAGPVNMQNFFGAPNPPNNCDPAGPFFSDPRAFYDPNDKLFWVAALQVENALGIAPDCPEQSFYWIANLNPATGAMHVYRFDMTLGTTNAADFTEFGFSGQTIAFSANMFDQFGISYQYAESFFVDKHTMETGAPVTPVVFSHYSATGPNGDVLLDTVQPVETETPLIADPGVQYLVNSFNVNGDPFGNTFCFFSCHGYAVWQYVPSNQTISGVIVDSATPPDVYAVPPDANQPACSRCIATNDTRISATPVYSVGGGSGLISFSVNTAVNVGLQTVPGILWTQIQVLSVPGFFTGTIYQSGYLNFAADQAAFYGAMMQDKNGHLVMVFDTSSTTLNPSIMFTSRVKSDPLGFLNKPRFIVKGPSPTLDTRWGDYEAASYDGFSANHIWVASQYSVSGDWNTFIAQV